MEMLQLAERFVRAIEEADVETVRACYAPDAEIWHNFDNRNQTVDENLKSLRWLTGVLSDRHYEVVRREALPDGFFQQHVMTGTLKGGDRLAMPACIICRVADGRITRLEEYLDPTPMTAALS